MALALFDLDETLIAGDSASLWLAYMVAEELAPASMIAEEQAMMSLYHQGKMDMHQYMAFTLQPLAGKTRQWLDSLCTRFAEQVLRDRIYPEGWHASSGTASAVTSWCSSPPPASIWWPHGADAGDGSLRGHPARRGGRHADRPDPRHPQLSRGQGGPYQPAVCRQRQPLAGEPRLQRLPQRPAAAAGGDPPHAVNPAPGLRQIAIEQAWPTLDWQLAS